MFIYFWEQVWGNEDTSVYRNFETTEIGRCYWDNWHLENRGSCYPTKYMEEGNDYINY